MDLMKVLMHGIKAFFVTLLAEIGAVLIGALTLAKTFTPEGALASVAWQWIALPLLSFVIGALQNWYKHRND